MSRGGARRSRRAHGLLAASLVCASLAISITNAAAYDDEPNEVVVIRVVEDPLQLGVLIAPLVIESEDD